MEHITSPFKNLFSTHTSKSKEKKHDSSSVLQKEMIVFSHLRWDFVKQRPQHLIERFSKHQKILFVEEPIAFVEEEKGTAKVIHVNPNLTVIKPRIEWNNFDELEKVVALHMEELNFTQPILWFYSASFVEMASRIPYSAVVYDCMDELAAFKGAPTSLLSQEKELLSLADVVFTGGKSLYESKRQHNDNVYCFPSSVDQKHFEKALKKATIIPKDIQQIPGPRVGFYGVVDERFDIKLMAEVADAMPRVSFVVIGPVVKINSEDLPRRSNIHYLGNKSYDELPNYLKAFDVAMMPFALNESTKFISPTKTLEFMAALKPIVSTPIYDVKRDYAKEVKIVKTAKEFHKAVSSYLHENATEKDQRIEREKAVIARTSWDKTAQSMSMLMQQALERKHALHEDAHSVTSSLQLNLSI